MASCPGILPHKKLLAFLKCVARVETDKLQMTVQLICHNHLRSDRAVLCDSQLVTCKLIPRFLSLSFFDFIPVSLSLSNTLACCFLPQKLWWQHIWPNLQQEMRADEVLAAVLQPALTLVQESSNSEYEAIILPTFK